VSIQQAAKFNGCVLRAAIRVNDRAAPYQRTPARHLKKRQSPVAPSFTRIKSSRRFFWQTCPGRLPRNKSLRPEAQEVEFGVKGDKSASGFQQKRA